MPGTNNTAAARNLINSSGSSTARSLSSNLQFQNISSGNNYAQNGTVYINTQGVSRTASVLGISYDQAYLATVYHELGHIMDQSRYTSSWNSATTFDTKMTACFSAEGWASVYAGQMASQSSISIPVLGVAGNYNITGNYLTGTQLGSLSQQAAALSNIFATDKAYSSYCKSVSGGTAPAPWLAPEDPSTTSDGLAGDELPSDGDTTGGDTGGGDTGGGGDGGGGCVAIESYLPDGRRAGDIRVDDRMDLADERSLAPAQGVVSYSQRKTQPGWRIVTQSGISLRCSASAPIPTPQGLVLAPDLLGKQVAVRRDDGQGSVASWETVESVQSIGDIEVQHITVGDRCFWAGEQQGAYILHHNLKQEPGGGEDDPDPWDDYDLKTGQPGSSGSTHTQASQLIGAMASFAAAQGAGSGLPGHHEIRGMDMLIAVLNR